jgi:hypothetical protein
MQGREAICFELIEIDAQPSDCIAIATQQRAPMYVSLDVWDAVRDMAPSFPKQTVRPEALRRLLDSSNRHYRRGREEDRPCRSSLGRASLTFSGRPPNSLPSKLLMAARPSASLPNVTNAKPLGWPVSLSVTILISVTFPNCSKIC